VILLFGRRGASHNAFASGLSVSARARTNVTKCVFLDDPCIRLGTQIHSPKLDKRDYVSVSSMLGFDISYQVSDLTNAIIFVLFDNIFLIKFLNKIIINPDH